MKKLISIFLLSVFLFNIIGYKAVFYFMEQKASHIMEEKLDLMKIGNRETVTIKIPINLPYQTNWANYERVDGEMTYKGVTYKYFKRKIYNDSLILVCVNFKEKGIIAQKSDDYFKKINDLSTQSSKKQNTKQQKTDDYCRIKNEIPCRLFTIEQQHNQYDKQITYPPGYVSNSYPPPDERELHIIDAITSIIA
ncbi:MAG: hypothetical protein ACXVAY_08925 [Mucilaginibacter sp.]